MRVVLGLPPLHGEALEQVADEQTHEIAVEAILKHLVMQEVVCEPPALLPEETQDESTNHIPRKTVGGNGEIDCDGKKNQIRHYFIRIE